MFARGSPVTFLTALQETHGGLLVIHTVSILFMVPSYPACRMPCRRLGTWDESASVFPLPEAATLRNRVLIATEQLLPGKGSPSPVKAKPAAFCALATGVDCSTAQGLAALRLRSLCGRHISK